MVKVYYIRDEESTRNTEIKISSFRNVLAKGDLVMDKTYVYSNSDQLYFDYGHLPIDWFLRW